MSDHNQSTFKPFTANMDDGFSVTEYSETLKKKLSRFHTPNDGSITQSTLLRGNVVSVFNSVKTLEEKAQLITSVFPTKHKDYGDATPATHIIGYMATKAFMLDILNQTETQEVDQDKQSALKIMWPYIDKNQHLKAVFDEITSEANLDLTVKSLPTDDDINRLLDDNLISGLRRNDGKIESLSRRNYKKIDKLLETDRLNIKQLGILTKIITSMQFPLARHLESLTTKLAAQESDRANNPYYKEYIHQVAQRLNILGGSNEKNKIYNITDDKFVQLPPDQTKHKTLSIAQTLLTSPLADLEQDEEAIAIINIKKLKKENFEPLSLQKLRQQNISEFELIKLSKRIISVVIKDIDQDNIGALRKHLPNILSQPTMTDRLKRTEEIAAEYGIENPIYKICDYIKNQAPSTLSQLTTEYTENSPFHHSGISSEFLFYAIENTVINDPDQLPHIVEKFSQQLSNKKEAIPFMMDTIKKQFSFDPSQTPPSLHGDAENRKKLLNSLYELLVNMEDNKTKERWLGELFKPMTKDSKLIQSQQQYNKRIPFMIQAAAATVTDLKALSNFADLHQSYIAVEKHITQPGARKEYKTAIENYKIIYADEKGFNIPSIATMAKQSRLINTLKGIYKASHQSNKSEKIKGLKNDILRKLGNNLRLKKHIYIDKNNKLTPKGEMSVIREK